MNRKALALAAGLLAPNLEAAEPLGRLFFTPEQRSVLERQRQTGRADQPSIAGAESLRLDGLLTRSGGRSTVWVNGQALYDPHAAGIRPVAGQARAATATASGKATEMRVGETLDPSTGTRSDLLPTGALSAGGKPPAP